MLKTSWCLVVLLLWLGLQLPADARVLSHQLAAIGESNLIPDPLIAISHSMEDPWFGLAALGVMTLVIVVCIVLKVIFWPSHATPLTPAERKALQEEALDNLSKMRMWQALGRNDQQAITDEMKLVELRQIRRLNE